MENWLDTYLKMLNSKPFAIEKKKGSLIGFNVNIDKIIAINPAKILQVIPTEIIPRLDFDKTPPSSVETLIDFFSCLFHSIKHGKADEVLTESQKLSNWIEEVFEIMKVKIGGQAGIIANLFSKLGLKKILLSLPVLDNSLTSLLEPNILTITMDKSGHSITPISKINNTEDEPIIHYVFEFTPGTYVIGDQKIVCKRDNRFILSYDKINTQLRFNEGFMDYCEEFLSEYSLAIISGFHLISQQEGSSQSFYDIIAPVETMLKKWKVTNPLLYLHLEIASTKDVKLRKTIIEVLFPLVDSIGLNEQELISFIEIINPKFASELRKNMSSVMFFKALNEILQHYPNIRIHFHYLGYFLILSKPIDYKKAQMRKQGLILSSLFAARNAEGREFTTFGDIHNVSLNIAINGYEDLKKLHNYLQSHFSTKESLHEDGLLFTPFFSLIGIPTIIVDNPKELVGLGDTISSVSILYETQ